MALCIVAQQACLLMHSTIVILVNINTLCPEGCFQDFLLLQQVYLLDAVTERCVRPVTGQRGWERQTVFGLKMLPPSLHVDIESQEQPMGEIWSSDYGPNKDVSV